MPVTPRGSAWQATATFRGARHRADFPTKDAAEGWLADALAALKNGRPVPPSKRARPATVEGTTLAEALDATEAHRWSRQKSTATSVQRGRAAVLFFGTDTAIQSLTAADLLRYQRALIKAGDKPATTNKKLSALSAMMEETAAGTAWSPPAFPKRLPEPEGRQTVLAPAEVERVEALLRTAGDHETADLVALLFWTGMRLGEMEAARWADVTTTDTGRSFVRVRAANAKNGSGRDVPLLAATLPILARRREEWEEAKRNPHMPYRNMEGSRLFPALRYAHALSAFKRAADVAGIEGDDLCLHTLRHSCATMLLRRGLEERRVQTWLGWKTLAMATRYVHVLSADLETAAGLVDGFQPAA